MPLELDLDLLKKNLFDVAKTSVEKFLDVGAAEAIEFYTDLREYTDNLAVLKSELTQLEDSDARERKFKSIQFQKSAIDLLVGKHKMILAQNVEQRVKEVLYTIAVTAGKIALSLALAAI